MKWVEISSTHINSNNITCFYWVDGHLHIWWVGHVKEAVLPDPDKKHYYKLCRLVGVRPYEEDD